MAGATRRGRHQHRAGGDVDIARAAGLFADQTRASVLLALADGRALPASMLAAEAGVSAPAASTHLSKLRDSGLIEVEQSGRHRYYRLAGQHVAMVLEALASIAPIRPVRSLREGTRAAGLRSARSCYGHLAGQLGVSVTGALLRHRALTACDGVGDTTRRPGDPLAAPLPANPYRLGPAAPSVLGDLGVDLPGLLDAPRSARPLLRFCLDWTEQRHHLAGRLGAALFAAMCDARWIERRPGTRAVEVTDRGVAALRQHLDLDVARGGAG
jgi:DNA-binding transcriptional ArsR family regulator